jgi:hypothetical protein
MVTPAESPLANMSPFTTPRKKVKYSSGLDISGLLTPSRHTPAKSSPLRQSVTPSKRKRGSAALVDVDENEEDEEDKDDEEEDGEDMRTPTKATTLQDRLSAARRAKERDGAAAFLALRPGASPGTPSTSAGASANPTRVDPLIALGLVAARDEDVFAAPRTVRKLAERSDWTFRERVWSLPSAADAWALLGEPVQQLVVPELIVTEDEDEEEQEPQAKRRTSRGRTTPKTTPKTKSKTPPTTASASKRATPRAPAPSLDSIIIAAWA